MRQTPLVLYLLLLTIPPIYGSNCPKDFFFFVVPVVPLSRTPVPVPPTSTAPIVPRAGVPAAPNTINVDRVVSVLGSCVRCHSAPNPKGKTLLFNAAGAFTPTVTTTDIYAAVENDSMPRGGPPLSARDKDLIRQWAGVTKSEVTTP